MKLNCVNREGDFFLIPVDSTLETYGKGHDYESALENLTQNAQMQRDRWDSLASALEDGEGNGFEVEHMEIIPAPDQYYCRDCQNSFEAVEIDSTDDSCPHCQSENFDLIQD